MLLLLLGIVVILIDRARQPDAWQWLDRLVARPGAGGGNAADGPIDTRLTPTQPDDGALVVVPPDPKPEPPSPKPEAGLLAGVNSGYLDAVRDDMQWRAQEQDAWYHLLAILEKTDASTLEKASVGRVTFAQLFNQSAAYRGKVVNLKGVVRRAHLLKEKKNAYGIESFHELWLQPADNRNFPIVVHALRLPEGFPTGMKVEADVELTGFYLKRWAYEAGDTLRTAPVVLCQTVRWIKRPDARPEPVRGWPAVIAIVAAVVASGAIAGFLYARTRRRPLPEPESPPVFDKIDVADKTL